MGHSFGGCTVIKAGQKEEKRVKGIIALDPFLDPLEDNEIL